MCDPSFDAEACVRDLDRPTPELATNASVRSKSRDASGWGEPVADAANRPPPGTLAARSISDARPHASANPPNWPATSATIPPGTF